MPGDARVLYLRGGAVRRIYGGADVVSRSVYKILAGRFGESSIQGIYMDELEPPPGRLRVLTRAMVGRYSTYPRSASARIRESALAGADLLFVDQSQYGMACRDAKKARPDIRCAVLFHNVERSYYLRLAAEGRSPRSLLLVPAVERAERAAVRWADLVIVLSERDGRELKELYGRGPDLVLPPALDSEAAVPIRPFRDGSPTMLFLGSAFPPNLDGVRWFIREVLPQVPGRLVVAGRGFEDHVSELSGERVQVMGYVEDLGLVYKEADIVVSPVFWGSGIKVKTAEAFRYGMPLVGAPEALEGYDLRESGALRAEDAAGFVAALRALSNPGERSRRAGAARAYFERRLSLSAASERLNAALDGIRAGRSRR